MAAIPRTAGGRKSVLDPSSQGLALKPAPNSTPPKPTRSPFPAPGLKATWLCHTTLSHLAKLPSCLGGLLLLIFKGLFCFGLVF